MHISEISETYMERMWITEAACVQFKLFYIQSRSQGLFPGLGVGREKAPFSRPTPKPGKRPWERGYFTFPDHLWK